MGEFYRFEHIKNNNCLEDTLCVLLNYDNIPFQYIYSYCWHLRYIRKGELGDIGKNIDVGWVNPWKALKEYVGYTFSSFPSYKTDIFKKKILELSKLGRPLIFNCDSFNADWTRNYHKYHTQHFCLFIGYTNGKIQIIDPLMSDKIEETTIDVVCACSCKAISPDNKAIKLSETGKLRHLIRPNVLAGGEKEYIESLDLLISDLKNMNINNIKFSSATFVQLENHKDSLMNIPKFMKFIGDERVNKEISLFEHVSMLWKKYIRSVLDKEDYLVQEDMLSNIFQSELKLIQDLCK